LQQGHARGPTAVSQLRATTKFMYKHTHMITSVFARGRKASQKLKSKDDDEHEQGRNEMEKEKGSLQ